MKRPYQQQLQHQHQQHQRHYHHEDSSDNDEDQNFEIDDLSAALPVPRRSSLIEAIDEAFYDTWKTENENDDGGDWDDGQQEGKDDEYDVKLRQQQEQHREHMKSTLALCTSLFTMIFLLSSLFPYSGFMVMELIQNGEGNNNNRDDNNAAATTTTTITKETVGVYAGLLTSAFMIGRAISAVIWGQIGDVYGRKFCLYVGCIASAVGSLAFGLCTSSFRVAFMIRFLMGLFNGTMVMSRTVITELAKGDKSLESKGVGLLMSMIGYGTLVAPVIGGCLSQPILNYPQLADWDFLPRHAVAILEMYPFLLPNLVGCVLSIMTFVLTAMYVPETLPQGKLRHWSNAGSDILDWLIRHFVFCWKLPRNKNRYDDPSQDEHHGDVWISQSRQHNKDDASLPQSYASETTSLLDYSVTSSGGDDDDDTEKISGVNDDSSDDSSDDNSQRSKADSGIRKQSSLIQVMLTYWLYTLVSVAQAECFPLFAMSTIGGLAMNTSSIGLVGTLAGCVYVFGQYVTFQFAMHNFGTLRTMRFGAFVAGTIVIAYPFGRFLSPTAQIVAMGLVMGIDMVAGSVFMGANTIEVNKLVTDPSQRGKINGITSMGTSIGRAVGPIIAGFLTTHFMNPATYNNHPELATSGGWFVYGILLVIGIIAFLPTLLIEDDDDRQNLQECAEFEELEV